MAHKSNAQYSFRGRAICLYSNFINNGGGSNNNNNNNIVAMQTRQRQRHRVQVSGYKFIFQGDIALIYCRQSQSQVPMSTTYVHTNPTTNTYYYNTFTKVHIVYE